jgi:hypothetical protein
MTRQEILKGLRKLSRARYYLLTRCVGIAEVDAIGAAKVLERAAFRVMAEIEGCM